MKNKLKKYIENSQKILITSHISPDSDAICSVLLLGRTLKANYPDKQVFMSLEELANGLDFLTGFDQLEEKNLVAALETHNPDLLFFVDAMNVERCTRKDAPAAKKYLSSHPDITQIIIDHHEQVGVNKAALYINQGSPATVQDVYEVCFDWLGLKKPKSYGEITMLGIISDSLRFKYQNPRHRETFKLVSDLIDAGASIEQLESRLEHYDTDQMRVFGELATNIRSSRKGYSYSFISDEFTERWERKDRPPASFKSACEIFVNQFIRNFENNQWGFIIYPDVVTGAGHYCVSLRSVGGVVDVSAIAAKLGGGGHKPATGAKIQVGNIEEAIEKVKTAIKSKSLILEP